MKYCRRCQKLGENDPHIEAETGPQTTQKRADGPPVPSVTAEPKLASLKVDLRAPDASARPPISPAVRLAAQRSGKRRSRDSVADPFNKAASHSVATAMYPSGGYVAPKRRPSLQSSSSRSLAMYTDKGHDHLSKSAVKRQKARSWLESRAKSSQPAESSQATLGKSWLEARARSSQPAESSQDIGDAKPKVSKRSSKKRKIDKKYYRDPWTYLSAWIDDDVLCDEFVPKLKNKAKCKTCKRMIDRHRRDAVKTEKHVHDAIQQRQHASRILGPKVRPAMGPDERKLGCLWVGGSKGIHEEFFLANDIKLCVTAMRYSDGAEEQRKQRRFEDRRSKAQDSTGAEVVELSWSDSSLQEINKEELADALHRIHRTRQAGGSVVVHCQAGQSRSSTVTLAYLMTFYHKRNRTVEMAIGNMKRQRPMVRPNQGFREKISAFKKEGFLDEVRESYKP